MSHRINQDLVNDALQAALVTIGRPKGVLVHSDRGSQYLQSILQKNPEKTCLHCEHESQRKLLG